MTNEMLEECQQFVNASSIHLGETQTEEYCRYEIHFKMNKMSTRVDIVTTVLPTPLHSRNETMNFPGSGLYLSSIKPNLSAFKFLLH